MFRFHFFLACFCFKIFVLFCLNWFFVCIFSNESTFILLSSSVFCFVCLFVCLFFVTVFVLKKKNRIDILAVKNAVLDAFWICVIFQFLF